jgi:UPF0716 protein FxsA
MPIVEIVVLMRVHDVVGFGNTVALVVFTGVAGAILARQQGFMILMQIRRDMDQGRMPAPRLIDGVMVLVAGVLLVTPGLITDIVGFLLLMPPVRAALKLYIRRRIEDAIRRGNATVVWDVTDEP